MALSLVQGNILFYDTRIQDTIMAQRGFPDDLPRMSEKHTQENLIEKNRFGLESLSDKSDSCLFTSNVVAFGDPYGSVLDAVGTEWFV